MGAGCLVLGLGGEARSPRAREGPGSRRRFREFRFLAPRWPGEARGAILPGVPEPNTGGDAAESLAERDQHLVARANGGDLAAFEELYRLHRRWAFSLALRTTGDAEDADDAVSEAFHYLLRRIPGLELTGRLTSLLYPVVRRAAIAAREKRGRYRSEEEVLGALPDASGPTDTSALRGELAQVLAGLPEGQREVLLLRVVDGLELGEIARALEIPTGTVKSRLHHGLNALREDERTRAYFEE